MVGVWHIGDAQCVALVSLLQNNLRKAAEGMAVETCVSGSLIWVPGGLRAQAVWGQHSQEGSWSSEVLLDKGQLSSQKSRESKMLCLEARPLGGARDLGREHRHRDPATWGLGDYVASERKS